MSRRGLGTAAPDTDTCFNGEFGGSTVAVVTAATGDAPSALTSGSGAVRRVGGVRVILPNALAGLALVLLLLLEPRLLLVMRGHFCSASARVATAAASICARASCSRSRDMVRACFSL